MEGEGSADSGAPRAPPRPPLAYEHLAFFEDTRCTRAEHEWAVKQILYIRTLGIAHLRGFASRAPIFQTMQSLTIKRTIWRYLDVAKLVKLAVEIVAPPTSESSNYTAVNMLAGTWVWFTNPMPAHHVERVVLGVAAGSRVMSFDVASAGSMSERQMCVEEVAADGTVGATLVAGVTISTANAIGFATSRYLQIVRFMTSDCIVWKMGARDAKPRM